MCRIVGALHYTNSINYAHIVGKMAESLAYAGPDNQGIYSDENITLGHRRLSIIDLSEAANQPMEWGRYVLTYNGEIYNFQAIKRDLIALNHVFTTDSDSEVILKAFEEWSYEAVGKFRGMFAFALWDKVDKKLLLCRDRVGAKPLFWYQHQDNFVFASELKAFHHFPNFDKTIDLKAVSLFLQQGYISAPHCIFEKVRKLEPGSFLEIDKDKNVRTWKYWDIEQIYAQSSTSKASESAITEKLESILTESFQLRMVADVPVGIFLSGGIDSSIVTALLQKQMNKQLKTFTIGFEDSRYNEAPFAKAIARHLETDHAEIICTKNDFLQLAEDIAFVADEPFGDCSIIPTRMVAKLAKESVKVSLSADGGDEIFGGYEKYVFHKKYGHRILNMPLLLRKGIANVANFMNPDAIARLPYFKKHTHLTHKFHKGKQALLSSSSVNLFNQSSVYLNPKELAKLGAMPAIRYQAKQRIKEGRLLPYLGMIDCQTFLEGDILTKVDRSTMAVALEGREPFLDQHIIEFAMTIGDELQMKNGQTKYLLRKILDKYVPRNLFERPKQGFSIPLGKWMKESMSARLENLANDENFCTCFQLNQERIQHLIHSFLQERYHINPNPIWYFFILHQWYRRWI